MATIAINVERGNKITVNLTNGDQIWGKRGFQSPSKAVAYVASLQANGHQTNQFTEPEFVRLLKLAGINA